MNLKRQRGFTLIEIAIVLVIIGLLLGGVLKGQELITAAKVRNLASQLDGVKVAYLGFQDRFRQLPGDMDTTTANNSIPGTPAGCGVAGVANCGNGIIDPGEIYVVWAQLSKSGFITGSYSGLITDTAPTSTNTPTNPFAGFLQLVSDTVYDDAAEPNQPVAMNIKTGANVPSGVIAELDRKIDDGQPIAGSFRSLGNVARTTAITGGATVTNCNLAGPPVAWNAAGDLKNCGGAAIQ